VLVEAAVAFLLVIAAASLIYVLGRRAAPKPAQTEGERSTYACGEKVAYPRLRVNVSLYKYLIYFVILDSSVMLTAFATFLSQGINIPLLLLYLGIMLAASLLLFEGGRDHD
jgi:NADH:ubiquinone oxidoreductase subunit 3 (subunit A)